MRLLRFVLILSLAPPLPSRNVEGVVTAEAVAATRSEAAADSMAARSEAADSAVRAAWAAQVFPAPPAHSAAE